MIDKRVGTPAEAVSAIGDGAVVMIGGFGEAGSPIELIHALIDQGTRNLTAINNNTGNGEVGLAALVGNGQVKKMICRISLWGSASRPSRPTRTFTSLASRFPTGCTTFT